MHVQNRIKSEAESVHGHSAKGNLCLQAALAERDRFLKQRPHMQAYQAEIDRVLDKSGNHQGRLLVLGMLMQGKLLEMQRELVKLNQIIKQRG